MYLQNKARRLISINTKMNVTADKDGKVTNAENAESFDLLPAGAPVNVPDKFCKTAYVKVLIKCGDVVAVDPKSIESEEEETPEVPKVPTAPKS